MTTQHDPPDPVDLEERWLKKEFGLLQHHLDGLAGRSRAHLQSEFTQALVGRTHIVDTPAGSLSFVLLGRTAAGRALTILTKQPATIQWIDSFLPNSVFWDVGANVGVYTLYAARRGAAQVVAFEPAAVNYFLLAANCEANGLDPHVQCLPIALGKRRQIARLEVSQFAPAESFRFGERGEAKVRRWQSTLVLSMDELVGEYGVPCPNYIKIDTPGMADAIIAGASKTLKRPELRELHIELRERSKSGKRIIERLHKRGFVVVARHTHGSSDLTFARAGESTATVGTA